LIHCPDIDTIPKPEDTPMLIPSFPTVSDRISRIVRMVDSGEWKSSRIPAYRILGECGELLDTPGIVPLLTDAERQWLTGVTVWISETLEDSARGEGVYLD
jgi:hypothetical protein